MELPRSWKSTPTEYDSNREYGLNLPRQVVSNKFTRELRIDGMDIFDVRLAQVMTGGLNNWGLRSLANGRHTVWESFKSRQEAIAAGTLMRSLRGDNSSQGNRRRPQCDPDIHDQEHVSRARPTLVGQPLQRHQGIDCD